MTTTLVGLSNVQLLYGLATLTTIAYVLITISKAVYHLKFSPLASIPGPWFAKVSIWYQIYYNVYLPGQLTIHIEELHRKYGPIVRIGPTEIHISDPEFHEVIYSSAPFSKYLPHYSWIDAATAGGVTIDHRLARLRRSAYSPFFSKQAVARFIPEFQTRLSIFCNRLNGSEFKGKQRPVRIESALACLTSDAIMQYCFARDYAFAESEDFNPDYMKALKGLTTGAQVFIYFPWTMKIMKSLPEWLVEKMDKNIASVFTFRKDVMIQAKRMIDGKDDVDIEDNKNAAHPTIFRELVHSNLPPEEKTLERLRHEAQVLVSAGGETIKHSASVGICHALLNKDILSRLKEELVGAWPDVNGPPPSLSELEQLPFLTAVIQEALRLSYGSAMRAARQSTTPITYASYTLPPGTVFSMSTYSLHHTESIFPSSHTFNPSRWLPDPITGLPATGPDGSKVLTRYLSTFSKGARICAGMNLAYAELYLMYAFLFRKVEMRLFETDESDVRMDREQIVPWAKGDSLGVRVLIL